jgi:general secretion pathway protein K
MNGRRQERGIALASVLWTVAALSLIAAAMLSSSMNAARISRNAWAQLQTQNAADTAIQRAALNLFDPRADHRFPMDGTPHDEDVDGITVSVAIQSEDGRIDLNYAHRPLLHDLFKSAGADSALADALADRIVDWRSPKATRSLNGAAAGDYDKAGSAVRPRGGPFQSVDELGLVMGMTPEIFARVAPALTVYSHSPNFDMRVAPKPALLTIPGMTEDEANRDVALRDGVPTISPTNVVIAAIQPAAAQEGHAYAIGAQARRGAIRFSRQAVVLLTGDPVHPLYFVDWK